MARPKNPLNTIHKVCPTCQKEFTHEKRKPKTYCCKTCAANSPKVKEKNREGVKTTFEKKYGGHPMAVNDETKEKFNTTMRETYGTDWFPQTKDFMEKVRDTKVERYGDSSYNNLEKMQATCLKKYGAINYRKTDDYRKKYVDTCNRKYGIEHASKSKEYKDSHKKTMFKKFLNSHKFKNFIPKFTIDDYDGVTESANRPYPFECQRCHTTESHNISRGKGPRCIKCDKSMSTFQTEVIDYIKQILPNEPIVSNNRVILSPLELDIYLPAKNFAIETDGLYWHTESSGGKNKNYHLNKTKMATAKGLRLLHIFENEWNGSNDVVKLILKRMLTTTNVPTDNLTVKELTPKEKARFLEDSHLDGNDVSEVRLGLMRDGELVGIMTFVQSKFEKQVEWKISRYCSKVGGAELLFNHFIQQHNPKNVVAHCDRRYFTGETYMKMGFQFVKHCPPKYHYIIDAYDGVENRCNWTKRKLTKKLLSFDPTLSEWENMKMNGFDRIWDCGHTKWIWIDRG